jgi:hypothetical protein
MKCFSFLLSLCLCLSLHAQAPFDPAAWPGTVDPNATVHFKVVDDAIPAPAGAANWTSSLQILSGGDQVTGPLQVAGYSGLKANSNYLNIADPDYPEWADDPMIDILAQVYGDASVLAANGQPRNFTFLIGTLPNNLSFPVGGQAPVEAKNFRWNWILFRIVNGTRADGGLFCGTPSTSPDATNGGVNGGTIRFEGVPGLGIRAIAFGPQGAFGEPEEINVFAPPVPCADEPATNHVWIDINASANEHLLLLSGGDQVTSLGQDIGPVGDKRKAARPDGAYMNFGITDNYLGVACNPPRSMKVCIEYYDDPASVGASFGPEAYATDAATGVGFNPADQYQTLAGTGRWVRRSWPVPGVNLRGVNTGPYTGGVRLNFTAPVYISRIDMAVVREAPHPLAGQDPLANCFRDLAVCDGVYGDYAEMDLASGLLDGIAPGNSGGDQEMIQEEAGPPQDRRLAVRPAREDGTPPHQHGYLNLAITDEKLGPTSQPNAHLAICVTYYDDPALAGASFRPEVHSTERPEGAPPVYTFPAPATHITVLQGSGRWLDSYVEIPNMKFGGVNQGPQAAARFAVSAKIFFSRVRYAVIRPCGAKAGQNLLAGCKPPLKLSRTGDTVRFEWVAGDNWDLQFSDPLQGGSWQPVTDVPTVVDFQNVLDLPISNATTRFFRLVK